ncbi:MAG: macro domain-containing protein [Sulfuricurvum sp.]
MITYVRTNIFESNAQVLVNTVNTVGVMGKGLALKFKQLYPDMFASYQKYCENGLLSVGKLQLFKTSNKWILNFPTKKEWRKPSQLEYIEAGLQKFVDNYQRLGIRSISFPMLGCGNGGLDWEEVRPLMEKYLKNLPIDVYVHIAEKDDLTPEHLQMSAMESWLKSEPVFLSNYEFISLIRKEFEILVPKSMINGLDGSLFEVIWEQWGDDEGIKITTQEFEVYMSADTLINLWSELKANGIVRKSMLPAHLAVHGDIIMTVLSSFDLMTTTRIGEGEESEVALRLLPHMQQKTENDSGTFAA